MILLVNRERRFVTRHGARFRIAGYLACDFEQLELFFNLIEWSFFIYSFKKLIAVLFNEISDLYFQPW